MLDKQSKVYLAGHSGMIGSAFLRRFKKDGFGNVVFEPRTVIDLRDPSSVDNFFRKHRPRVVILAAGRTGGIHANQQFPAEYLSDNLSIQLNTMRAAHEYGTEQFVFFGSSCMYPKSSTQPMHESLLLTGLPEATSLPYAVAKLAGTYQCLAFNQQYGRCQFYPVIPNNVYGPHDNFDPDNSHVMAALITKFYTAKQRGSPSITLWGTGQPRREFLYVDDLIEAILHLLSMDRERLELPINIGTGKDITVAELAVLVAKCVGYTGDIRYDNGKPDGTLEKLLDNHRIFSLGWSPRVSLEEGIMTTYHWFSKQTPVLEL